MLFVCFLFLFFFKFWFILTFSQFFAISLSCVPMIILCFILYLYIQFHWCLCHNTDYSVIIHALFFIIFFLLVLVEYMDLGPLLHSIKDCTIPRWLTSHFSISLWEEFTPFDSAGRIFKMASEKKRHGGDACSFVCFIA